MPTEICAGALVGADSASTVSSAEKKAVTLTVRIGVDP
jgi:hypothetical protein